MKKDSAKDIKIAFFDVDGTLVDMEKGNHPCDHRDIKTPEREWNYFMYGNRTRPISCSIFSRN